MQYEIKKDKIVVYDKSSFNIAHILECGQIFNYEKTENSYIVYSLNKKAVVVERDDCYEIVTSDTQYFEIFFDLKTNYLNIKNKLKGRFKFLDEAIKFGYGIRILNQDPIEMIISFIISANNNIPRIRKSISGLCKKFGDNMGDYFAFPTLTQLSTATEQDFKELGLGYRAVQMVKAIKQLKSLNISNLKKMSTQEALNELIKLSGVGPKVADCIMLFGLQNKYVFPVDTWINKIYNEHFTNNPTDNRKLIREKLTEEFGDLSGYAQQYLFYFGRSGKN